MSISFQEIQTLLQLAPAFKPVVKEIFESLKEFSDEFDQIQKFSIDSTVKYRAGVYKGLIANGVPEDHALVLAVGSLDPVKSAINSVKTKSN